MGTEPEYEPTAHHETGYVPESEVPVAVLFAEESETRRSRRPSREKQRRRRRRTIVMLVVLVFFAGVVFGLTMFLRDLLGMNEIKDYEGAGTGSVSFTVAEGDGPMVIGNKLEAADIVATSKEFVGTFQTESDGREIQPGSYEMKQQMSSSAALEALLGEQGAAVHYAAVARDLRQGEVFEILSTSTGIPLAEFEALAKNPQAFGLPAAAVSLEGYLHPGEYRFPLDQDATSIVTEMVNSTFTTLEDAGITDPDEQYRILTKASIIQAEAGEADYAKVAGAIQNRLREDNVETSGLIQSDATVTYGLNRKSYDLTPEEKADKSNPYNTYANPGLPVGPIGSPSTEAVEAAANPADVPFYYWVTVNLDTGQTEFSSTLAEHAKYVAQYQEWCATQKPGRCG
ncbi:MULTISPECIES: endolytic transglycosylase MltG [unclassified Arthrobacter]|uniref:endolytic transglycosylase MltG n=1 Tax=unclassified Arthrobacter TaxID=235627 RepID=UPI0021576AB3|nr:MULTISPECIES: endolytic transglycosylase MltG [unclassified Arthrobacter]